MESGPDGILAGPTAGSGFGAAVSGLQGRTGGAVELVKSGNAEYEEYERLLMDRDQLKKEAGQIRTRWRRT